MLPARIRLRRALIAFVAVFNFGLGIALAQEKSLYWRRLDVQAKLDHHGRLRIAERQTMVFTGDWNGGERRFHVRLGQNLTLHGIARVDSAGVAHPLREGDLSAVDHYAWPQTNTMRWRSRLPSDPRFDRTEIAYLLDYTLENVLVPRAESYLLNHDFAFPDRSGLIELFTLAIEFADVWHPARPIPLSLQRRNLQPGQGVLVTVPLIYSGATRPAGVYVGVPRLAAWSIAATFLIAVGILLVLFYRDEKKIGRFEPLIPAEQIDRSWLEENLFRYLPEVVGAAWDDRTAAAEVAAVLARMTTEGKIRSRVESAGFWPFRKNELHLTLLIGRDQLQGYEAALVKSLFVAGDMTSTMLIREHYKSRGFDPVSKIRDPVSRMARRLGVTQRPAKRQARRKPRWQLTLVLALIGIALLVPAFWAPAPSLLVAAIGSAIILTLYIVGLIAAVDYQSRVVGLVAHAVKVLIPLLALVAGVVVVLVLFPLRWPLGPSVILGLPVLALAAIKSILNIAKIGDSAERLALRKRFAAARNYFKQQLRQREPRLEDAWFPYLLAFGLGSEVDRWFRGFRGALSDASSSTSAFRSSSGPSSSGRGWTGGGGAFGGAGASGSWAVAAGALASGVSAPSSSGSGGGGGGGGGSSGGGGGGGW